MVQCPLCNADIDVEEDELDEGDSISCDECGSSLNVASLSPLELEAEEDDEDEEDEEEFFDEEDGEDEDEDEEDDDEDW